MRKLRILLLFFLSASSLSAVDSYYAFDLCTDSSHLLESGSLLSMLRAGIGVSGMSVISDSGRLGTYGDVQIKTLLTGQYIQGSERYQFDPDSYFAMKTSLGPGFVIKKSENLLAMLSPGVSLSLELIKFPFVTTISQVLGAYIAGSGVYFFNKAERKGVFLHVSVSLCYDFYSFQTQQYADEDIRDNDWISRFGTSQSIGVGYAR